MKRAAFLAGLLVGCRGEHLTIVVGRCDTVDARGAAVVPDLEEAADLSMRAMVEEIDVAICGDETDAFRGDLWPSPFGGADTVRIRAATDSGRPAFDDLELDVWGAREVEVSGLDVSGRLTFWARALGDVGDVATTVTATLRDVSMRDADLDVTGSDEYTSAGSGILVLEDVTANGTVDATASEIVLTGGTWSRTTLNARGLSVSAATFACGLSGAADEVAIGLYDEESWADLSSLALVEGDGCQGTASLWGFDDVDVAYIQAFEVDAAADTLLRIDGADAVYVEGVEVTDSVLQGGALRLTDSGDARVTGLVVERTTSAGSLVVASTVHGLTLEEVTVEDSTVGAAVLDLQHVTSAALVDVRVDGTAASTALEVEADPTTVTVSSSSLVGDAADVRFLLDEPWSFEVEGRESWSCAVVDGVLVCPELGVDTADPAR